MMFLKKMFLSRGFLGLLVGVGLFLLDVLTAKSLFLAYIIYTGDNASVKALEGAEEIDPVTKTKSFLIDLFTSKKWWGFIFVSGVFAFKANPAFEMYWLAAYASFCYSTLSKVVLDSIIGWTKGLLKRDEEVV